MKYLYLLLLSLVALILMQAVSADKSGRQMEDLDRGIIAIRTNPDEVFIRLAAWDWRELLHSTFECS